MSVADDLTATNTAFLADCYHRNVFAENRHICREFGLKESKDEIRKIRRFISQAIIALITKNGITQRDGRPFESSCPKGFFQDPHGWVSAQGFRLIGWPDGLPKDCTTTWRNPMLCAVAVLFIKDAIHLEAVSGQEGSKKGPKRVFRKRPSQLQSQQTRARTPESEDEVQADLDRTPEQSETETIPNEATRNSPNSRRIITSTLTISRSLASSSTAVSFKTDFPSLEKSELLQTTSSSKIAGKSQPTTPISPSIPEIQEMLFDLPIGLDVTDLTPTIVRSLLSSSCSDGEDSDSDASDNALDRANEVFKDQNVSKREFDAEIVTSGSNKRGRVS